MSIIVQKFGGTSLSTADAREHAIRHIRRELEQGYEVVVVVSAMGRSGDPYATDTLLSLVAGHGCPPRERDLLMSCGELISATNLAALLHGRGINAVVLTGGQAGIITDSHFGNARILEVKPARILELLRDGYAVIVTGFQGMTTQGDLTTLGRGGSDTSATALGAGLKAERVDIYTDVNGIMTADPRFVENARPLPVVSYAEMCNLARQGAKVIHPRAVEIAEQARIPVRVRSTFSDEEGTLVTDENPAGQGGRLVDRHVAGIAHVSGVTQLAVVAREGQLDVQLQVFQTLARNHISVDFINLTPNGTVFTVFDEDAPRAIRLLEEVGYEPVARQGCAKVSVVGGGMNGVPGIMARIVEALADRSIPILQSADSNTTIWVLVEETHTKAAIRALHDQFQLHGQNGSYLF